jgi:hypothetical protein
MAKLMAARPLVSLAPVSLCSLYQRLRIYGDAYIPWAWVQFPEPPVPPVPPFGPVPAAASALLDFFVHGDGRGAAAVSGDVGTAYRIRSVVEVDLMETPSESYAWIADNQYSMSELRAVTGHTVVRQRNTGGISHTIKVYRVNPTAVSVEMTMAGNVPWNIAGPQPDIDFKYTVEIQKNPTSGQVHWDVKAEHDGFPAHEFFLESDGVLKFSETSYVPAWFSPVSVGTARPNIVQACEGATALGGLTHKQTWSKSGTF